MGSIQVNKTTARKLIEDGYTIKLVPCNIRLKNLWFEPYYVSDKTLKESDRTFDQMVNEYEYYNCNNPEMGRYPHYYLHLDFSLDGHLGSCLSYKHALLLYNQIKERASTF